MQFLSNDQQMHAIKLIIWDMDDTFWHGTISEGSIQIPPEHITLVKTLAYRGIVSSICSKNDLEPVERALDSVDVSSFFVFKSVDWTPKGARIKQLIEDMNLRADNVLFIDDNVSNLREAEYYCPTLMTAGPEVIDALIRFAPKLGKDDSKLSRLAQYKVLEEKQLESQKFDSNEDFLRSSEITLEIKVPQEDDCARIHELIQRSNQLNFTKLRSSSEEVLALIRDPNVQCGCVYVNDKFGQYGMVGFYAVREHKALHFLFSCRTMGMGIEQYVYATLGYPELHVIPPVSGSVDAAQPRPSYIREGIVAPQSASVSTSALPKILLKGPCDLQVMASYIEKSGQVETEFNFVNGAGEQMDFFNHTVNIINTFFLPEDEKESLSKNYPFLSSEAYQTALTSTQYDIISLSVLMDSTLAVYRHREKNYYIPYGLYSRPITDRSNWSSYIDKQIMTARSNFTEEMLAQFSNEFELVQYTPDDIVDNLKKIMLEIKKTSPHTKFVLITLSELPYRSNTLTIENPLEGKEQIHQQINKRLHEEFTSYQDVLFLDVNQHIKTQADYFDNINHYSKLVYYHLAQDLIQLIQKEAHINLISKSKLSAEWQNVKRNAYKLFCKLTGKI